MTLCAVAEMTAVAGPPSGRPATAVNLPIWSMPATELSLLDQVAKGHLTDDSKYDTCHELDVKREQFNTTVAAALALSLSATPIGFSCVR